jgi:hypothetical protein
LGAALRPRGQTRLERETALALAVAVAGERPGYAHVCLVAVSLWLAAYGKFHYNAAIRELDKRACPGKAQAITTAGNAREKILDIARHAATTGRTRRSTTGWYARPRTLRGSLGGPWRELESFMTAADTPGSTEPLLAHADFTKFTAYLEHRAADPRLSPRADRIHPPCRRGLPLPGALAARPALPMLVRIAPEIPALLRLTAHPATVKAERTYPMR